MIVPMAYDEALAEQLIELIVEIAPTDYVLGVAAASLLEDGRLCQPGTVRPNQAGDAQATRASVERLLQPCRRLQ